MKKIIFSCVVFMISIILISSFFLLQDKLLEIKIAKLNREIYAKRSELQSLKVQWNYLNNKDYLKSLVSKYLPEMRNIDYNLDVNPKRVKSLPLRVQDNAENL